jgi:hypothetical protein
MFKTLVNLKMSVKVKYSSSYFLTKIGYFFKNSKLEKKISKKFNLFTAFKNFLKIYFAYINKIKIIIFIFCNNKKSIFTGLTHSKFLYTPKLLLSFYALL